LTKPPEYIVVGRFGRRHGVSGEIYIIPLSDNPGRFNKDSSFWVEVGEDWKKIKVVSSRPVGGKPVVRIENIDTPEKARELTNEYIYIQKDDLEKLPEGTYYHFDLIGCSVEDDSRRKYGSVVDIEQYPANDVMVIESENGGRFLFPMVKRFIKDVNLEKKVIIVQPPDGIFDFSDEN
jgi:16S rRNA processing protein RimM